MGLDIETSLSIKIWCRKQESNLRPTDYESVALPAELFRRFQIS